MSLITTAIRSLMSGGATLHDIALALILPAVLTVTLAPMILWLYRRQ